MLKDIFAWLKEVLKKPDKYADLKNFPVLSELNSFELYLLNNFLHKRTFAEGEVLYEKGHPLEVVYFILSGKIEANGSIYPAGHNIIGANQVLGIIDMFNEETRSCSAKAITTTSVYAISRFDLMELIKQNPHLGIKLYTAFCKMLSNYIFKITAKQETAD
ncbi:MAG: cyclic nucleotide-binding domain-containing protein [Candidatus Cloacimonas sp.]